MSNMLTKCPVPLLNRISIEDDDIILNDKFRYNLKDEHFWNFSFTLSEWVTKGP